MGLVLVRLATVLYLRKLLESFDVFVNLARCEVPARDLPHK